VFGEDYLALRKSRGDGPQVTWISGAESQIHPLVLETLRAIGREKNVRAVELSPLREHIGLDPVPVVSEDNSVRRQVERDAHRAVAEQLNVTDAALRAATSCIQMPAGPRHPLFTSRELRTSFGPREGWRASAGESGDPTLLAITRTQFRLAHEFTENFQEAVRWLEEAAEASKYLDENQQLPLISQARGRVRLRLKEVDKGLALTEDVIDARSRRKEYGLAANSAIGAGVLLLEIDKERAARWAQRWLDVCNAAGADYEFQRQGLLLHFLGLG